MFKDYPDYFSKLSYLVIEPNSQCNLSCKYCNRSALAEQGQRSAKKLDPLEFQKLLDIFQECPVDSIKIEGLSEPMMHTQFDEICALTRRQFPNAFIIVATNLQYEISKTKFLSMIPHVDLVYLSIDGIGETYEKLRAGAKWHRLIQSLDFIQNNISAKDRNKLAINFTANMMNVNELPAIYDLKEKYGIGQVRINLAQNWNENEKNLIDWNADAIRILKKYAKDMKGVGNWDFKKCFWPFNGVVIDVFGNIRQCIINTSQVPIGNVSENNFREIYNRSAHYVRVRSELKQNKIPQSCQNCDYKQLAPIIEKIMEGTGYENASRKIIHPNIRGEKFISEPM